jgi:trans-2,3-dihydro-3-hydroxyanthranilate isomerase
MRRYEFVTVDVFTDSRFGGNPLAVFTDAEGLTDEEMQSLATELNLSETTFVLPASSPAADARVRIFNRVAEMPFAGHPNVGTAFVLASMGRCNGDSMRFEEMAGLVEVTLLRDEKGLPKGASIDAPKALMLSGQVSARDVAQCIGAQTAQIICLNHQPVMASVGFEFVLAEVTADALECAMPRIDAFRTADATLCNSSNSFALFIYARSEPEIRARMFAPLANTWEDPATGSASASLGALLLSLGSERSFRFNVAQGIEMGRPSRLAVEAWRAPDGIRARVSGSCVTLFRGFIEL